VLRVRPQSVTLKRELCPGPETLACGFWIPAQGGISKPERSLLQRIQQVETAIAYPVHENVEAVSHRHRWYPSVLAFSLLERW